MKKICLFAIATFALANLTFAKDLLVKESFEKGDYAGYSTSYPFSVFHKDAFFYRAGELQLSEQIDLNGYDGDHYLLFRSAGPNIGETVIELDPVDISNFIDLEVRLSVGAPGEENIKFKSETYVKVEYVVDDQLPYFELMDMEGMGSGMYHGLASFEGEDMLRGEAMQQFRFKLDDLAGQEVTGNQLKIRIRVYTGNGQTIALDNIQVHGNMTTDVELFDIKAKRKKRTGELSWITSKEINLSHFEIEKINTNEEWETIGEISAKSIPYANYNFNDPHPNLGANYYRIKSVFLNGEVKESPLQAIKFEKSSLASLIVYPGKTSFTHLWLEWTAGPKEDIVIRIADTHGNTIINNLMPSTRTKSNVNIELLQPGVYVLEVVNGTESVNMRLVKEELDNGEMIVALN